MVRKKRSNLFKEAFILLKEHHLVFWKVFGVDLLIIFILSLVSFKLDLLLTPYASINFFVGILYFAVIIITYNYGKRCIQHKVANIVQKTKQRSLKQFIFLNLIQWVVLSIVTSLVGWSLYTFLNEYKRGLIAGIIFLFMFLASYAYYNLSHAVFFRKKTIVSILSTTKDLLRKKTKTFVALAGINLGVLILFSIGFLIIGKIIEQHFAPSLVPPDVVRTYDILFSVLAFLFFIAIHYYNRIVFQLTTRKL